MTAVGVASRRQVHVGVRSGVSVVVGSANQQVALAGDAQPEHGLAVDDLAPRAIALQVPGQFGMAFQGRRLFTAIGAVAGRRGERGPSGSAIPAIAFSFGDASPRLLHTFDDAVMLADIAMVIDEPFDGAGAALRVLTGGGLVLLDADQNAPALAATFEATPSAQLAAGAGIWLEITPGAGATAGAGKILLTVH